MSFFAGGVGCCVNIYELNSKQGQLHSPGYRWQQNWLVNFKLTLIQSCNEDSSKIFWGVAVKDRVRNLYHSSTTLGVDPVAHPKLKGYTMPCELACFLTPKVATKSWILYQQASPSIIDPTQSPPPKSSKNLRCNSATENFNKFSKIAHG